MIGQQDLFGEAYARRADPETSHEAADEMVGGKAGRMEALVMEALQALGGEGTAFQCYSLIQESHPGIDSNTITPRFKPLEDKNLIQRTERRGPGRGSRMQIIWEVRE